MKTKKVLIPCILGLALLTGCGASFSIDGNTLKDYADSNDCSYTDVSSDYSDYDYVEGVYVMEKDDIHIELWDLDSTEDASEWFNSNMNELKDESSSSAGSYTPSGGKYSFKVDGKYYKLMFSEDKGIYSYGTKDDLNTMLSELGIDDKSK